MFAQVAARIVEEQRSGVGAYDQVTDSLHLLGSMDQIPIAWSKSLYDFTEMDMSADDMVDWDVSDVADIFTSWAEGQPVPFSVYGNSSRKGQP